MLAKRPRRRLDLELEFVAVPSPRITSYNVCYTKLLRVGQLRVGLTEQDAAPVGTIAAADELQEVEQQAVGLAIAAVAGVQHLEHRTAEERHLAARSYNFV